MSSRIKPDKESANNSGYTHYGRCVQMKGLDNDVIRFFNYSKKSNQPIIAHKNKFDGITARW